MELQTRSSFTREEAQAAELKQMWDAALKEYDESRAHADSQDPSASSHEEIDSCTSLEEYLEEKNKDFKSFRAKKKKLFGALRAALQPVQAMGSIASGAASTVFAPSSSIFSAVTFLVQAAQNVTKKYDMIISMFEEMQRFTDRLKILARHGAMDDDLRKEVVKTMAIILKFIGVVEKAIRDGRTVTFFKRAFTAEDPVQTVRDELDGSVQQVIRLVESLTYSEARLHHKDEDIARDRQEKRRKWAALEKRLDVNAAMPNILDDINNAKLENTCEWIRDDPSFIRWMSGSAPVLWVSGRMGTGKTHLAADLVRFLRSSSKTDMGSDAQLSEEECEIKTGIYFCGKTTSRMDSSRRILDTLVYQLACQSGSFFDKAVRVYDVLGNQSSSRQLWEQLFQSVIHSDIHERYVVVIDGLDELEETELEDLLKRLEWLCLELGKYRSSAESTTVNLPFTIVALGRPSLDDYVGSHFEQDLETIEVLWEKSAEDLGAYIRNSTDRSRDLYRLNLSTELREEIVKTLERGADGSFLWVKLKVQEISKQSQVSKIRAILETPPAQLGEQLEKTLYSLSGNDSDAEALNTILTFTTWFEGHIHLDELALVPKLESDNLEDEHGFVGLEDLLVVRYRPLFKLQRDDGLTVESLRRMSKVSDLNWIHDSEQSLLEEHTKAGSLRVPRQAHQKSSRASSPGISPTRYSSMSGATTASFDHLSYHQYFRSKTKIEAGNLKLDKNLALHRIAKICLRLLTDSTVFSEFGLDHSLTQHAALNFSRYLDQIHRSELPLDLQRDIAQALSRLFEERQLTRRWINILAALPAQTKLDNMLKDKSLNEKSLTICCSWLETIDVARFQVAGYTHDQHNPPAFSFKTSIQSWVHDLLTRLGWNQSRGSHDNNQTRALVFNAVACAISDEWLSSHNWVDETASPTRLHALYLCAFIAKTQNPSMTEDAFNEEYLPMAPASIRDAASWHLWRHYSNTSDWHTCLALTYYGMGYRWSTIWACQQAVVLDEAAWHAFYLLSLSHMDLGHGETALSRAEKSLKFWPSELAWSKLHYRVIRHLADCKRACGDDEGAYSTMTNGLRERPTDLRAFRAYIEFIDDKETWNRDLELLSETIHALHGCRSSRYVCSKASELLLDDLVCDGSLQSIIIRSLRAAGKSRVGIEIFVKAIEAAETIQKPQYVAALKIDLADLLYENKRSITHAVRCIRQSLNMDHTELSTGPLDDSHSLSLVQQMVRYRAIASLTRYTSARLLRGIEKGDYHAQTTAYNTLNHLWELGTNVNAYIPIWLWFQRHCWYHCFLGASKLHDTERFAEFWSRGLRTVIGMLARPPRVRGDNMNEGAGLPFRRLAYMFQISGRPQESLAALSVRVLLNSTVAALQDVGEDISFFDFICDGPCTDKNGPWRTGRGLHRCQLCLDTDWCDDCMVRLEKGEIAYTLCSAAHPFLHIMPFKKPEEGYVVRGNCTIKITDWIGELAEESGLSEFWGHFKGRIESAAVIGTAKRSDSGSDFDSDTYVDSESDLDSEVHSDGGSP